MKLKYLIINIIGIILIIAMFGIYMAYGGTLEAIPIKFIIFIVSSILIFFATVAIIDTVKHREVSKYGKITGYMFWVAGLGIAIYGVIKILTWKKTGTIETYSTTGDLNYYKWKDDYIYILLEWTLYSIAFFIIGIISRAYISVISWIAKKITCACKKEIEEVGNERF